MKDPAFLFYAKDFYEGTRTMLPKERACYIDLMIYQHQHGAIPNDIERVLMYCGGIDEATLKNTLDSKFVLTDNGWVNMKLQTVIDERREFSKKQSANGLVGQFFKKAKSTLSAKDYRDLKHYVYNVYTKEALIQSLQKEEATHEGLLKALLKHLEDVDENEDVIVDKEVNTHKLSSWIDKNATRVNKMKEPLTFEQCTKLKEDFHNEFIMEILTSMHNYEPLLRKNRNANLTFRNWANRDERYKKWREAKGLIEITMNT